MDYPITPKEHGIDFLMDHRHLWLRSERQHAILRVRHEIIDAVRDYFDGHGFTLVDTPIFTPAACEGTTTLFEVDYFEDDKAYLTQSGQLYNEATAMAFGKVYCFGPTFRAEKSKTRRHLTEFWMVEPEMAYATLDDVMELAEELVVVVVERVLENRRRGAEDARARREPSSRAVKAPFPRITYDEAVQAPEGEGPARFEWGGDFGGTDETVLSGAVRPPAHGAPLPGGHQGVLHEAGPGAARAGAVRGRARARGLRRDHRRRPAHRRLRSARCSASEEHNLPQEAFEWYLDLRKYGSVPHAGFGMGIERCVAWICGLEHVRETIPFPRMLYRLYP